MLFRFAVLRAWAGSIRSLSSVPHRHAGGWVLIAVGWSSGFSWSDRGHHVPAITVTSGGRGVGLTWHVRALRSATATLGLRFPASGATRRRDIGGALRDGSGGLRSPVRWDDNTGSEFFYFSRQPSRVGPADRPRTRDAFWCGQCTRWQVLCVQTGSFSCLQLTTGVNVASCCGSSKKTSTQRGVAGPLFLGSKKHRVVNMVTDARLATAGLRGG